MADLTPVVDHAARQQWQRMTRSTATFDDLTPGEKHAVRSLVLPIVTDVAQIVEQQVREQIALTIDMACIDDGHTTAGVCQRCHDLTTLARGGDTHAAE